MLFFGVIVGVCLCVDRIVPGATAGWVAKVKTPFFEINMHPKADLCHEILNCKQKVLHFKHSFVDGYNRTPNAQFWQKKVQGDIFVRVLFKLFSDHEP